MKPTMLVCLGTLVLSLAACGDEEPEIEKVKANAAQAKVAARSTVTGLAAMARANDARVGLASLVTGVLQAQTVVQSGVSVHARAAAHGTTIGPRAACVCTATECSFDGCTPEGASGVTVSGKITFSENRVVCENVRYDGTVGGAKLRVTVDCDVHTSGNALTGFVEATGSLDVSSIVKSENVTVEPVTWMSDVDLAGVGYDESGPKSGTGRVDARVTVGTRVFVGGADVSFP